MSSVSMVRPRRSARRRTCAPLSPASRTRGCFGGSDSATRIRCVFGGRPRSTACTSTSRSSGGATTFWASAQEDSSCSQPLSLSSGAAPTSLRHFAAEAPAFDPRATSAAPHPAGRTSFSSLRAASRCRLACQSSRTRVSSRSASTSSANASAPSTTIALGAANMPTVTRCEAISRAPAAASSMIRLSARSFSGTIASASSRALVRARYSSPSMRTTACAFPAEACPIRSAISDIPQLSRPEQQAFELQPAVAVLVQGLDHVGAERGLSEEAMGRNALRDLPCPGGELAHLWRASRSRDQEVPRPALYRLRHFQRRVAVAVRLGEIQRLALVRRLERVLHLLQQLAPFALRGERAREAALCAPRPLARLALGGADLLRRDALQVRS